MGYLHGCYFLEEKAWENTGKIQGWREDPENSETNRTNPPMWMLRGTSEFGSFAVKVRRSIRKTRLSGCQHDFEAKPFDLSGTIEQLAMIMGR